MSAHLAAERILTALQAAKDGNYYNDAWYFYLHRSDVEECVDFVLRNMLGDEVVDSQHAESADPGDQRSPDGGSGEHPTPSRRCCK